MAWPALLTQALKISERHAWLYENQDHPQWDERNDACGRSEQKLSEMRRELAEWADADEGEVSDLLAECLEARLFGADE